MSKDDIIRMARGAGSIDSDDVIQTVYAAFAAAEREACAQECDKIERRKWDILMNGGAMSAIGARDCAAAIRARSNT